MELLSQQHALVRKREQEQIADLHEGDLQRAVAELRRERKAHAWDRLAYWAALRAERVRNR